MRLPATVSKEQITTMVDKLLADLGILECADVLIGGVRKYVCMYARLCD